MNKHVRTLSPEEGVGAYICIWLCAASILYTDLRRNRRPQRGARIPCHVKGGSLEGGNIGKFRGGVPSPVPCRGYSVRRCHL